MEVPGQNLEGKEKEGFRPKYMIFLGRHAERSIPIEEPIIKDKQDWHRKRHNLGAAPKLPRPVDQFDENTLSLRGIYQAHDFGQSFLERVVKEIPEGKIKFRFFNTEIYRTQETGEIIIEGIKAAAKKIGKYIEVEGPETNKNLLDEPGESADKSVKDLDELIRNIKEDAQKEASTTTIAIGITHAPKLLRYISEKTGKAINEVSPCEFAEIKEGPEGKEEIEFI